MKLSGLLHTITYEKLETEKKISDPEVRGVFCDSRKVCPDGIFVCIRGSLQNGMDYAAEAIQRGAAAIVARKEEKERLRLLLENHKDCMGILVEDERKTLSLLAAAYEGYPAEALFLIGVTGTKGKTTTTYMIRHLLEKAGYKAGLIGTVEQYDGEKSEISEHTTPDAVCLQNDFHRMIENGCDICVMEVSSQALKQSRTYGVTFDVGIFLNIGKDHISSLEHENEEEYLECKKRLFFQSDYGIGNRDDPNYERIFRDTHCKTIPFGIENGIFRAVEVQEDTWVEGKPGIRFKQNGTEYAIPVPGRYTVYNALAAITVCSLIGVDTETMRKAFLTFSVKGRSEFVEIPGGGVAVIDYAHNAMSLRCFLETMRKYRPRRLITVFGCGGGRAKDRRFEMGEVSGILSDLTIITSDNPRWERPEDIMHDVEIGIRRTKGQYVCITDRKKAVAYAVGMAKEGDLVVIAGKGHESYQEINGIKYEMDERRLVEEACTQKLS